MQHSSEWPLAPLERGGNYSVLYCDPPWKFRAGRDIRTPEDLERIRELKGRGAPYLTMTLPHIAALPVREIAAPQAVLFMWITGPFFAIGAHLPVMKAWGFKPKAIGFTWVKLRKRAPGLFLDPKLDLHVGLGLTTRKNAEFCLIGTRGRSLRKSTNVHEVGLFPLREHSRKPDEFRTRIENYVGEGHRKVELFARAAAPGWEAWGNEVGKFK